ncbi:ABC transporter substrate-binding protein [Leeuwenhoekiella polynyae]|uniref:ABC-type branched-subunit amino acid transport system substrate-binding protein n=1 Tax=Leeuwenhoekiella polynyae TaxID=1550906 RepID=A0A4Q0NXP6_9FLAO|nr:ABC transporter substrate-binding protein [Leeuwenhoekiella polynyae]RXG17056.1 ABC-type branched-subunit amino acid transport system substrate-binding protein [Leeuwenhoekiella polynyae]
MDFNIGVVLPQSKEFPKLGKEFINGIRLVFDEEELQLKVEGIGFGNNSERVIDAIEKLSNQNELSCITGILGHKDLSIILDHIERIGEQLIYTDFGATCPLDLSGRSGVFCNSLDLYGATELLGRYFLDNKLFKVATSTCYYESGYGFIEAIQNTLYKENQGSFAGHFITPLHPRSNEAVLLKEFVEATTPDVLFAFHNGTFAKEHAEFLAASKVLENTPLYTLPFTVTSQILDLFPALFDKTRTVSSWLPEDTQSRANIDFMQKYFQKYKKQPSVFAILGYENGLLMKQKLEGDNYEELHGPRGLLKINSETNRVVVSHRLWEINWNNESYEYDLIDSLTYSNSHNFQVSDPNSGWHNAYLCV